MKDEQTGGARPSERVDDFPLVELVSTEDRMKESAMEAATSMQLPFGAPENQNAVPCCVSVALTAAAEFIGAPPLSALFNYFKSRPDPAALDDVQIADAFRSARSAGVCTEAMHADDFERAAALNAPSAEAEADARSRPIRKVQRVPVDENQWRMRIRRSQPVLFGFFLSPQYEAILDGTTNVLAMPTSEGRGHAALVIGFDDAAQQFTIRDSRGTSIGPDGTWKLPYSLLPPGFIFESWAITAL
jgi:hypothetical protein